jgi:CRP-like cAMP-binding protein
MYLLKSVKSGDVILTEGTIQPYIFILKSGKLTVVKSKGRDVKIVGEVLPGEFIGEMAYLGEHKMHQASVIAIADSEIIEIPSDSFLKVLADNPVWLKALLRSFVLRIEDNNSKKVNS